MGKTGVPNGGIIHTYLKYDPRHFPSPTQPPPDMLSGAMEHMLHYGGRRKLTPEELARAVRIDPSQIAGLGPSLDALREMLRQRKEKILRTYETDQVQNEAAVRYRELAKRTKPPGKLAQRYETATREEQLYDLERLWYQAGDEKSLSRGSLFNSWHGSVTSTRSMNWQPSMPSLDALR